MQQHPQQHPQQQHNASKNAAWRAQIPTDSVDPITLESLSSLPYPPFALVASAPYTPIDWPLLSNTSSTSTTTNATTDDHDPLDVPGRTEEERQRQILEAQWGKSLHVNHDRADSDDASSTPPQQQQQPQQQVPPRQHVNLYDGRALAYYMVSQLQFIDPLNRRDITRDELIHLDHYLRRHEFHELNVVEAYDTKGVTLSSAGAVANTARGRTMILQQEAQALLNALFGGNTVSRPLPPVASTNNSTTSTTNTFREQYEAHEATHRRTLGTSTRTEHSMVSNVLTDLGMVIIDDDENPGLRGNASTTGTYPLLYSAHHIATRHGGVGGSSQRRQPVTELEFPSLSATVPPSLRTTQPEPAAASTSSAPKILPKVKTLSKISKTVKQTNPEEQQRQWEAREEARRKAMMANLTFGSNPTLPTTSEATQWLADGIPSQITTMAPSGPSQGQIERNRALAEALGVPPAPLRSAAGGWARPTERSGPSGYEGVFADEVNRTIYPDSLIKSAKELRLDMILKLEKKWKLFLNDDKAASLPLYPMDRTHRAFVHEYAGFWKLHTESFDPEPKRYVHCVKLLETCAPYPLISEAMKHWSPNVRNIHSHNASGAAVSAVSMDHSTNQTSGQCTTSSDQRFPPREFPVDIQHQRVPLSLQKRTLPLELPPFESTKTGTANAVALDLNVVHLQQQERHEQKVRKKQEKEQRKQRALQSAFASDDEQNDRSDDDSEWEERVAIYHSDSSSGSDGRGSIKK